MSERRLFLARHGTMGSDAARRFVGITDLPLAAEGERQALWLHAILAEEDIRSAYCSDLRRCRRTAELILAGRDVPLHPCATLREACMGTWEGRLRAEIAAADPARFRQRGEDIEHYRIPGGESMADCRNRVVPAIRKILAASTGNVLIVAHAAVNRLLLCDVLGIPVHEMFRLGQDPGCLNILRIDADGGLRAVLTNFAATSLSVTRQFPPANRPIMETDGN